MSLFAAIPAHPLIARRGASRGNADGGNGDPTSLGALVSANGGGGGTAGSGGGGPGTGSGGYINRTGQTVGLFLAALPTS